MTSNREPVARTLIALRLYFPHSARVVHSRMWHHINRPALATHLLTLARRESIGQALLHHVEAGYLSGDTHVRHRHVEHSHKKLPQCLELIDTESKIRAFWAAHRHELADVSAMFFLPCEEANQEPL